MSSIMGFWRTLVTPGWMYITGKLNRWFREVPKIICLNVQPCMMKICFLYVFITGFIHDTVALWMGFHNKILEEGVKNPPVVYVFITEVLEDTKGSCQEFYQS